MGRHEGKGPPQPLQSRLSESDIFNRQRAEEIAKKRAREEKASFRDRIQALVKIQLGMAGHEEWSKNCVFVVRKIDDGWTIELKLPAKDERQAVLIEARSPDRDTAIKIFVKKLRDAFPKLPRAELE